MKASKYTIATLKETPADAEIPSHQLLIRAGFIRKVASGIYNWLPMGLRVLQKVENIIREEMNHSGAQEVMMPVVQPGELWEESGRWAKYDDGLLLKFKDRHERDFCLGPTHEEVITELARNELKSHKQLPVNYYQIQTKFRDETRPRFGLMRAREFLMKDAYSFHLTPESLEETYDVMHQTYARILERMTLDFRPVQADSGAIGGDVTREFQVLAESGEDKIAFSTASDYAANIEMAEAVAPSKSAEAHGDLTKVHTLDSKTIEAVAEFLKVETITTVKTLIVVGNKEEASLVALVIRGDHQLNTVKAEKVEGVASPLQFAEEKDIQAAIGCGVGSIGPVNIGIPVVADRSAAAMANFVCGANKDDYHFTGANWDRDANASIVADLRDICEGDPSPDGKGVIAFKRGIEVGHIFQLGDTYSKAMNASVLDENGKAQIMYMGCYGMGVSRLVAAAIEQNHDDNGMIWPTVIAPFQVIVIPINGHKSPSVASTATDIYDKLRALGFEVLLDDREGVRPGAKFADAELIGIPHRVVVGDRGLEKGVVEYAERRNPGNQDISVNGVVDMLAEKIKAELDT
jgi:prolyl-tRNA synthetase